MGPSHIGRADHEVVTMTVRLGVPRDNTQPTGRTAVVPITGAKGWLKDLSKHASGPSHDPDLHDRPDSGRSARRCSGHSGSYCGSSSALAGTTHASVQ